MALSDNRILDNMSFIKTFCFWICALAAGSNVFGVSYSYDSLNRLTNVNYGNGSVISYTYDPAGNRLTYSAVVSSDTTPPTIVITSPTTGPAYTNSTATVNLGGTASDNVGVTLVTWANDRGGLGTATGTNSWSITGIPLQTGANALTVTAYDAAGNSTPDTVTVTLSTGGTGTTTNTVFTETGSGSTIDPTKWTTSGNTVTESGGTMQVLTTVTDNGGVLVSVPVSMSPVGDVTISRRVFLHYGSDNYVAYMAMRFGDLPATAVLYGNANYNDETYMPRYGTFIGKNVGSLDYANISLIVRGNQANMSAALPVLWDTWFNEKVVYSPTTGVLNYFVNDHAVTSYFVGIMPETNAPTMQLGFRAWGWWTGHEELFSDLVVSQVVGGDMTAPSIAITSPTSAPTFASSNATMNLSGTASDNVGVTSVIWANDRGGVGTATGTTSWSVAGIPLQPGTNVVSVTAYDAAGNITLATLTVVVDHVIGVSNQLTDTQFTNGILTFTLNGLVGSNYIIEVSSDLINWLPFSTNTIPAAGLIHIADFDSNNHVKRFYRLAKVGNPVSVSPDYTYTTNNGAITITSYTGSGSDVNIPAFINSLPVTGIGQQAFYGLSNVKTVAIPNSVTSIGLVAFESSGLTSLTIPNSVINIGNYAFDNCSSLTNVIIGSGITSIGEGVFVYCSKLASVTIPNSVTSIGYATFGSSGLSSIVIPSSVTSIDSFAFDFSYSLKSIYFQGNAPTITAYTFYGDTITNIFYLQGTTGWGATFGGFPTAVWHP